MPVDLSKSLVVGISSRALFDLEKENSIFELEGEESYRKYQRDHEEEVLKPGSGFPLVRALLQLNSLVEDRRLVEVMLLSRNSGDTGIRIFHSINQHKLDITRGAFVKGKNVTPYVRAFDVDLFLSRSEEDVQQAINGGFAGALLYNPPEEFDATKESIRIAFDGDAVLFSEESERIYKEQGLDAFLQHEQTNAKKPLPEGPFAKLLKTLSFMQSELPVDNPVLRIALVTARNSPAHERVLRTLRTWNVEIDEVFFLGGVCKDEVLKQFQPHIFFDDQHAHLDSASKLVPSGRVPYKGGIELPEAAKDIPVTAKSL